MDFALRNSFRSVISEIFKASCNINSVRIQWCKIVIDNNLDFGHNLTYSTKCISFMGTGFQHNDYANWNNNQSDLVKILQAIKSSPLFCSLESINLRNCGLKSDEIESLLELENFKLEHIKLLADKD